MKKRFLALTALAFAATALAQPVAPVWSLAASEQPLSLIHI